MVQSSLIGSILSNLLLVLGMCFLLGGLRYSEQSFSVHSAQTSAALLALSSLGLVLPAAFDASTGQSASSPATLAISRGTSLILLIVYGLYLYFQLKTHRHLYESPEVAIRESAHGTSSMMQSPATNEAADASLLRPSRAANAAASEEEKEEPTMMMSVAIASLVIVTILVAVSAEFMVSSIEGLTASSGLNEAFIGMVIVPIVGNAAGRSHRL